jgi:hypothetical protein
MKQAIFAQECGIARALDADLSEEPPTYNKMKPAQFGLTFTAAEVIQSSGQSCQLKLTSPQTAKRGAPACTNLRKQEQQLQQSQQQYECK